jgi:hypothetical protein
LVNVRQAFQQTDGDRNGVFAVAFEALRVGDGENGEAVGLAFSPDGRLKGFRTVSVAIASEQYDLTALACAPDGHVGCIARQSEVRKRFYD